MEQEIWKDIPGYEGLYRVSSFGNVKSLKFDKEMILKQSIDGTGYFKINLHKSGITKTRKVHQLVAITFLNHNPKGYYLVVNHINFNKLDNRLDNLEIVTNRENSNLQHIQSTSKYTGVYWNKEKSKWRSQIKINGKLEFLGYFNNEHDASIAYRNKLHKITT